MHTLNHHLTFRMTCDARRIGVDVHPTGDGLPRPPRAGPSRHNLLPISRTAPSRRSLFRGTSSTGFAEARESIGLGAC